MARKKPAQPNPNPKPNTPETETDAKQDMPHDDEFPLLAGVGLYAASVVGDGDCLFHALSDQLYGHQNNHREIRERVVNHLSENATYFKNFIDVSELRAQPRRKAKAKASSKESLPTSDAIETSFQARLQRMRKSGVFGDNLEIQAFAHAYAVDVKIYQYAFSYVIQGVEAPGGMKKRAVVHIAYHTWEHYSSIRNRLGPHAGLPNVSVAVAVGAGKSAVGVKDIPIMPWMTAAVAGVLPYDAAEEVIEETLKRYRGNVDRSVEDLIEKWNEGKAGEEGEEKKKKSDDETLELLQKPVDQTPPPSPAPLSPPPPPPPPPNPLQQPPLSHKQKRLNKQKNRKQPQANDQDKATESVDVEGATSGILELYV